MEFHQLYSGLDHNDITSVPVTLLVLNLDSCPFEIKN